MLRKVLTMGKNTLYQCCETQKGEHMGKYTELMKLKGRITESGETYHTLSQKREFR